MPPSSIHYLEYGSKYSQPILFLHGFMGSSKDWLPIIRKISNKFYCLAVDLPGHGNTDFNQGRKTMGMKEVVKDILCLIEVLNIHSLNVIGYSLGGRLALFLALKYSQKFKKVILESASPGLKTDSEKKKRLNEDRQLAQMLTLLDFEKFLIHWYNQPVFGTLRSHINYSKLFRQRLDNNPKWLAKILISLSTGAQPSLWAALKQNKIPLLLLTGEYDIKFKVIAEEMVNISPSIKHVNIKGAGHNIHFEQPAIFVRKVIDFLSTE